MIGLSQDRSKKPILADCPQCLAAQDDLGFATLVGVYPIYVAPATPQRNASHSHHAFGGYEKKRMDSIAMAALRVGS